VLLGIDFLLAAPAISKIRWQGCFGGLHEMLLWVAPVYRPVAGGFVIVIFVSFVSKTEKENVGLCNLKFRQTPRHIHTGVV